MPIEPGQEIDAAELVDIPSQRFLLARMPDGDNRYVLEGRGAGNSPEWATGVRINAGTYTGDGTVNRGIAHGLGVAPKFVFIQRGGVILHIVEHGKINYNSSGMTTIYSVTIPDSTNFYVGNSSHYYRSGNGEGTLYYWFAIG